MDGLPLHPGRERRPDQTVDRIGDVGEVAAWVQPAELDLGPAFQQLGEDGGKDRAGGLTGTVGVEGAEHQGGRAEASLEGERQLVGPDLGRGVGRLGLQRVGLRDGNRLGRAVDLAGGGVDETPAAAAPGRLEQVEGSDHVGVDVGGGRGVGVGDGDEGGQVEHHLDLLAERLHEARIPDVTQAQVQGRSRLRSQAVEPAGGSLGIVEGQGPHPRSLGHQPFDQMAADEAVRPRDQDRNLLQRRAGHSDWPCARESSALWPTSIQSSSNWNARTSSPWETASAKSVGRPKSSSLGIRSISEGLRT